MPGSEADEEDAGGAGKEDIMLFRRFLRYVIAFLCIFLVISLIVVYQYRDVLATYFSSTLSSGVGILLYLLVYAVGIGLLIKAVIR